MPSRAAPSLLALLLDALPFRSFLPLGSIAQIAAASKCGSSMDITLTVLAEIARCYNSLVDACRSALISGVYCPCLESVARGTLYVDGFGATSLQTRVLRACHCAPADSMPFGHFGHDDASVLANWAAMNDGSDIFLSLHSLLHVSTVLHFQWLRSPAVGSQYFTVAFCYENLHATLVFEKPLETDIVIQID